jgi:phosphonate degradation associated HDIG domain protein
MSTMIERIEELFAQHGHLRYSGACAEPVTAQAHALQCAQLAEWANADLSLVAAALLHDIGHLLADRPDADQTHDLHALRAATFLRPGFGPEVVEPIRLHVQAKRFLVANDAGYAGTLSPASRHSLQMQGGPMSRNEGLQFSQSAHAGDALSLRRWDDLAKQPGKTTPPLAYYLALLDDLQQRPFENSKVGIGSLSVA